MSEKIVDNPASMVFGCFSARVVVAVFCLGS
jgi:hypothetical protein